MIQRAGRPVLVLIIALVGVLGANTAARGHALQPGYLELRLLDKGLYAVVWKVPAKGFVAVGREMGRVGS